MKKQVILFLSVFMLMLVFVSAFADSDDFSAQIGGAWKLDAVYESGVLLDPETSQSLYAERVNVYIAGEDGNASVFEPIDGGPEYFERKGTWSLDGKNFRLEADGFDMDLEYNPEENELHRYLTDDDTDAVWKSLNFVYKKYPVGDWKLVQVISREPGADPVVLDPENAGALYSESANVYSLKYDGTFTVHLPEDAEEKGTWKLENGELLLINEDGLEMMYKYDPKTDRITRVWTDDDPQATYHDLEFVYQK